MNGRPTESIRREHQGLMEHLGHIREMAYSLRMRTSSVRNIELQHVFDWLTSELLPHARAEEEHLYPLVDRIMGAQTGAPSTTMSIDHAAIRAKVQEFGEVVSALNSGARGQQAKELRDRARVLAYQIDALLSVHFQKEEEVYLELIDQHSSPEEIASMLKAAHGEAHAHHH